MKIKKLLSEETNPSAWKKVYMESLLLTSKKWRCPFCPPRKGCNRHGTDVRRFKSWKNYRDKQYRID